MAVSTSEPARAGTAPAAASRSAPAGADRAPRIPHIRPLDGLRGIAVLAVVLYHFAPDVAPGGFLGVDMFFVLSGFLITSLLVAERESTGHTRLRDFWVRRARRLFPALFLVLVAVGLWSVLKATPLEAERLRDDGFAAIGYVANWRFIFSGQSYLEEFIGIGPSPLRHTWSLAIEEQFYLLWPLVVAGIGVLLARRARSGHEMPQLRRVIVVLCLVAAAVSVLLMGVLFSPGDDPSRVYYGTDTRAHLLLIGAALGAATAGVVELTRDFARKGLVIAGSVAALGLVTAFLTIDPTDAWLYDAGYGLIAVGVAVIIAAAGQSGTNPLARILGTRPLVALGLISYGVYLWHWPITVWFDEDETGLDGVPLFLLRSALTLAVSIASYLIVEMPIRKGALRKIKPALPRIVAPLAIAMAVFVLLLPTIGVARLGDPPVPEIASVGSSEVTASYADVPRCDAPPPANTPAATDGYRVDLIGNSVAREIKDCLGTILTGYGIVYRPYTQPGAAICDFFPFLDGRYDEPRGTRPDAVVLYFLTISKTECTEGLSEQELVQQYTRDMRSVVKRWRAAGVDVFLVPPMLPAAQRGESPLAPAYRDIAKGDPEHIRVLDTGTYLRDASGTYQYRMPCLPGGEVGCEPDGYVTVRLTLDDEHMCSDVTWRSGPCPEEFAAGERRGAAAIAAPLLLELGGQP